MFKVNNPCYFYPFFFYIPLFALIASKWAFESTAKTIYLGKSINVLIMLFLQFSQNCVIAVVHYWLHFLHLKFGWPTIFLNITIISIYMEIIGFTLYDYENTRHNMQIVLPSTYVAYLGRFGMEQKLFHVFWSNIKGAVAHSNSVSNIIKTTILDSPGFWIEIIIVLLSFGVVSLVLVIVNWKQIVDSVFPKKTHKNVEEEGISPELIEKKLIPDLNRQNVLLIIFHVLAIFDIIFNISIRCSYRDFKALYFSYLPYLSSLLHALSHFEDKPSKQTLKNVVNLTRNFLPPGRYWIDTRSNPIYPEVHADLEAFCAYNPSSDKCSSKGLKLEGIAKSTEINIENKTKLNAKIIENAKKISNNDNNQNVQKNANNYSVKNDFLKPDEVPNVILLLYESFNPATYLISKEFLQEHVKNPNSLKTDTPFYNKEIMPFLYNFSKEEMVTFSGMQTLGLPSFSGLHSILTQEPPSQTYMNIINGWQNHVDDIPTHFHMKGYRTLIVNANRFDFDGKQYWIYKKPIREEARYRMKCLSSYGDSFNDTLQKKIGDYSFVKSMRKECSDSDVDKYIKKHYKEFYDFPRWFDYAAAYYPTHKQAEAIGLDPNTVFEHPSISVSGDRIVAKEIEAHWKQQKDIMKNNGEMKPIFTLASSVDGHMPYTGYDQPQFYPKIDSNIKPHSEEMRVAHFLAVNKYTDEYFVKELIEWFKKNDPNTILLFTGDHATRDIPAKEKNKKVVENIKYDPKCVHESTGSDSFFYVTGGIAYLGKDERIKKAFGLDKLAGKTIKFTVDHGDMIYTAEEILRRLQGKTLLPTNRKSRNIIDMSLELLEENNEESYRKKIDESGWKSVSMVSHMVEYHNGMKMIRFHPGDIEGAHIYKNCVYPTGLLPSDFDERKDKRNFVVIREEKDKNEKKKHLEFVNEALQYLAAENYISIKNRLYNYAFRDEECIKNKKCRLPDKLPDLDFLDGPFIIFLIRTFLKVFIGFSIPVMIGAIFRYFTPKRPNEENKDFDLLLKEKDVPTL